jgi:hypothetical protein
MNPILSKTQSENDAIPKVFKNTPHSGVKLLDINQAVVTNGNMLLGDMKGQYVPSSQTSFESDFEPLPRIMNSFDGIIDLEREKKVLKPESNILEDFGVPSESVVRAVQTTPFSQKVRECGEVTKKSPKKESKEVRCKIPSTIRSEPPYRPHDKLTPRTCNDKVYKIRAKCLQFWRLVAETHLEKTEQVIFWESEQSKVIKEWNEIFKGINIPQDWNYLPTWKLFFEIVGNEIPRDLNVTAFYHCPNTNIKDAIMARLLELVYHHLQSKHTDKFSSHLKTAIGLITGYYKKDSRNHRHTNFACPFMQK